MAQLTARSLRPALAFVVSVWLIAAASAQTVSTWTNAAGGNWSTPGNWSPLGVPQPGPATTLIFPGLGAGYSANNDLGPYQLNQLWAGALPGTVITLSNGQVVFTGPDRLLLQFGAGALTINNAVALSATTTVGGSGTGTVAVNGSITGTGGLVVNTAGTVALAGPNAYAGGTFLRSGMLNYNQDAALGDVATAVALQGGTLNYIGATDTSPTRNFAVDAASTLSVVSAGARVLSTGNWSGAGTLTKTGPGTLQIAPTAGTNTFFGGLSVSDGTLQTAGISAVAALRMNPISLAGTATFAHTGAAANVRHGELSGQGTYNVGTNSAFIMSLLPQTMAGAVTVGGLTVGGTDPQTFTGNTTGWTGPLTVESRGGVTLAGNAAVIAGVGGLALRDRGMVRFDNAVTQVGDRFRNADALTAFGGTISLIGNVAGSTETLGTYNLTSGQNILEVRYTAGAASAALVFNALNRAGTGAALNFTSPNSSFVTTGSGVNGPIVAFTTAPATTNNVISTGGAALGFAIVNGTDFADYSAVPGNVGVIPTVSTPIAGVLSNANIPATTNGRLTGDATIAAGVPFTINSLKISPTAVGQSLSLGGGNLATVAILLDGSAGFDYAINNGSITGGATRHFHVWDPNRTLTIGAAIAGGQPMVKSGDGLLWLTAPAAGFTGAQNVNLVGGTTRASTSYFTANSILRLRGGVFEIDSAGAPTTFARGLGIGGGQMSFDDGGGFSAFDSSAAGNVGVAVTIAGGPISWEAANFVQSGRPLLFGSNRSNAPLTFTNDLGLGTAPEYNAREIRVFDNPASPNDRTILSGIVFGAATSDLLKTGPGTLELTGLSTYSGNTIVAQGTLIHNYNGSIQMGSFQVRPGATLQVGPNSVLPTEPESTVALLGGTLELSGRSAVLGTLAMNGGLILSSNNPGVVRTANNLITANGLVTMAPAVTLNLTGGATTDIVVGLGGLLTVGGGVGENIAGASLNKSGPGTLQLRGVGSYTGPTTINAGTLLAINAGASATGAGPIFVNGGTLGGVRVGGPVTIRGGGHIAPGNSPGTLVVGGAVTLSAGSNYDAELASGGISDQLSMGTNALSIFDTAIFNISGERDTTVPSTTYTLASLTTSDNIFRNGTTAVPDGFVFATLTVGTLQGFDPVALTATATYQSGDMFTLKRMGNDLVLMFQPVPEPVTVLAVFLAGAAVYGWRRSRRAPCVTVVTLQPRQV